MLKATLGFIAISLCLTCPLAAQGLQDKIDWDAFLARHDLVYDKLPEQWEDGAFTGNGQLGAMTFTIDKEKSLRWHIGRSDVQCRTNRIPIGDMVLNTVGKTQSGDMRLHLYDAILTGKIVTDKGEVGFESYTHADQMVQVITLKPSAGEEGAKWAFRPGLAVNPRLIVKKEKIPDSEKNPEPKMEKDGDIDLCIQPYSDGPGHATAWIRKGNTIFISVGFDKSADAARRQAIANVNRAIETGEEKLLASHKQWWRHYYPESFVSIPDTRLESFYWIQMYKLASATRSDRPAIDLMGPWFRGSPWCKIWWNLNIQLSYWPVLTGNRLELGESLCKLLDNGAENLAKNAGPYASDSAYIARTSSYDCISCTGNGAGPSAEICNLPWALHSYYLQYRYSMDEPMLKDRIFPLLKRSINYDIHLLQKGPDGKLHISSGYSPEYPGQPTPNPDCNIDVSLLRWGCMTLLETCERLKIEDPMIPKWKEVLADLTPYPTDKNGLMISAKVPFAQSHRHFSHLLMIFPLYIMNIDQPENRELVVKSLNHWMGMPKALQGYSFTGAASISAMLGKGDDAAMYLNKLLDMKIHRNTMYTESGPVIETPLSAAASLHDMLLSSWGDRIRLFPGVPAMWKDVAIQNLRTQGAFLVSAVRKDGKTQFARIESLAGQPCRFQCDLKNAVATPIVPMKKLAEDLYEIELKKGESVVLTESGSNPDLAIAPVAPEKNRLNFYGLRE